MVLQRPRRIGAQAMQAAVLMFPHRPYLKPGQTVQRLKLLGMEGTAAAQG
jgi:hypothetical protein